MTEDAANSILCGISGPYATIVADPPWKYEQGGPHTANGWNTGDKAIATPPYPMMSLADIACLPVEEIAADNAHLYLWTTNRYLRQSYSIAEAWGFKPSQMLTWCKPPRGIGPGGAFSNTTEFCLYARRGKLPYGSRIDSTWWTWPRRAHSVKPDEFLDIVERVSPGPYVELFARRRRAGWDAWGNEVAA